MLNKSLILRFPDLQGAQMAAPFLVEGLAMKTDELEIIDLKIIIGKAGEVVVSSGFKDAKALKKANVFFAEIVETMKRSFLFRVHAFDAVAVMHLNDEGLEAKRAQRAAA
jgi:hypothetical protein